MLVKRLTLAAGVETAFEFDEYASKSVIVKNETAGAIQFCDGPFDAAKAAHISAFSWQALDVRMFPGEKPKFHVKAAAAGAVEIDFGSVMAGCASGDGFGKLAGSSGVATGGTVTTLVDATKNLPADLVKDQYIAIIIDGVEYVRKISANNANTFTFDVLVLKAAATAVVEKSGSGKVTITATPEGSYANAYEVAVVQGEGASAETAAAFEDGILNITLGTNATAAEVAAEVDVLEGFSAVATVAGVLEALAEPVAFSGGVDEVKPVSGTHYEVVGGIGSAVSLSGSIIPDTQPVPVNMVTSLSSDYDTVNVNKMGKGSVTTVHSAITANATSAEIDCRGYNAILISAEISAEFNWTFKVQGCMASGGTFVDCYEQANTGAMAAMSYQTNASKIFLFKGIPDYIKIVATEGADGATVTVKVQPLNV